MLRTINGDNQLEEALMSDLNSTRKANAGVCTNYSPGGYKKPSKPEPEKDREKDEGPANF